MWERPEVSKLIELVKLNDCLYNIRSINYFNKHKRVEAFENIWREMQRKNSQLTLDQVKMKWKVLRTQFMAEQRQIAKCQREGTLHNYKRKLWCFDELSFLGEHKKNRNSKLLKETNDDYVETYYYEDDLMELPQGNELYSLNSSPLSQMQEVRFELIEERTSSPISIVDHTDHSETQENNNDNGNSSEEEETATLMERDPENMSDDDAETSSLKAIDNAQIQIQEKNDIDGKYNWLGELVGAQMNYIDPEYQQDAAWQIQCLMRKWIVKTRKKIRRPNSESIASY